MKINRVFDNFGPEGFIPNAWNYKYSDILWDNNYLVYHKSIDEFNKKYGQISVFDCNLNLPEEIMTFSSISELHYDEGSNRISGPVNSVNGKSYSNEQNFFYTIHPFGDVYTCLGKNYNYHQNESVFDNISLKAKKYSHADNFFIIFDYSTEGDIQPDIFYYIHSDCEKNNINIKNVIVISSASNTFHLYNDYYVKEKNPKEKLKAAFYPWSLLSKAKDTQKILFEDAIIHFNEFKHKNSLMSLDESKTTNRPKKALCLNRRLGHHRIILISMLISDGYLDNSLISFDSDMLFSDDIIMDIIGGSDFNEDSFINNKELKQKATDGFRKMKKIGKSVVDYDDIKNVWGFAFEQKENYIKSYFSIVTETLFYRVGNYISEKTWKPIAHLHPFVIVGRPGTLEYLKQLGFKTFSDFWDESYDSIECNSDRMESVYKVITTLLNKTTEEWDELYISLIPILEWNRNKLLEVNESMISKTYYKNLINLINEPNQETHFLL